MNDTLLLQIDKEIAFHFGEVAKLQAARKALAGSSPGRNGTHPVPVSVPGKRTPVSDDIKDRVLHLSSEGRLTIPKIAKEVGISEKSVVRIRGRAKKGRK